MTQTATPDANVPVLEVDSLCKAYGEIVVADSITFSLDPGECLGVIGPNGAGKSSLFNLLAGVATPDRGSIRIAGQEITRQPTHRRARLGITRAFQIPQPFARLSVLDNVLAAASFGAGLHGQAATRVAQDALERTSLGQHSAKPAGTLPLLDRKRLELAKGIASQPRLLLLDEVAGGLTEHEVQQIVELVRDLKRSHAVIWIEHIAHALKSVADRVMVLHFGRKLLDGLPQAVMDSAIVREIYMGTPADAAT